MCVADCGSSAAARRFGADLLRLACGSSVPLVARRVVRPCDVTSRLVLAPRTMLLLPAIHPIADLLHVSGICGDVSTYPRTVLYVVACRPPLGHVDASTAREHTRSTLLGRTQKLRVNGHPGTAAHTPTTPHICQGFSLAVLLHSTPVANHRRTRASAHCESSPSHTHACRMIVVVHAFTVRSQKVQHFNAFI